MPQPTAQDTETPYLDNAKLQIAIEVAVAKMGLSAAEIARQAGITEMSMSNLRAHGQAGVSVQMRLLRWLDIRPSVFEPATPVPAHSEAA